MDEAARQKLAALGIRSTRYEDLVRLFPPELVIERAGLDATTLAEVLVCFVEHGLVRLRPPQAAEVATVDARHLCHYYRSRDEVVQFVPKFMADGLARGERCLWAIPSWLGAWEARAAMEAAVGSAVADGRVTLLSTAEIYGPDGELRPADALVASWLERTRRACDAGATGLRISGDGTWSASDPQGWRAMLAYEHAVHEALGTETRLTALCTYGLAELADTQLAEMMGAHDRGVVRSEQRWEPRDPAEALASVRGPR